MRRRFGAVGIAIAAFIVLGLPEGGLGTAWPALRISVNRPVEDLGVVLVALIVGYQLTSIPSGRIVARLGTPAAVTVAALVAGLGLVGYAIAPSWPVVLAAAAVTGLGGGLTDTAFNAHAALNFDTRQTNLLHAGFGIGATAGPIIMTTALATGQGWRLGFLVFAAIQLVMVAILLRRRDALASPPNLDDLPRRTSGSRGLVITFFLYTGLEVAAGQWAFTLLTEGRSFSIEAAGLWVALYWGGLTVGRLVFGAVRSRPHQVVTLGTIGSIVGVAWLWWDPAGWGALGLPVAGLSLAGIFPAMVVMTPDAVGTERSGTAIGFQLSAAAVGAALVPWAAGRVIGLTSLEALGPFLLLVAAVLLLSQRRLRTTVASNQ